MSKKTSSSDVVSASESKTLVHSSIAAPPASVSAPPEGWVTPAKLGKKGRRPWNGLTLVAPDLSTELRANASALSAELGPKAVDPAKLASAIDLAYGWSKAEKQSVAFNTYARVQRGASWDSALTLFGSMQAAVRYVTARDATFADRFPGVAKAFAPRKRSKKSATSAPSSKTSKGKTTPAPVEETTTDAPNGGAQVEKAPTATT